MLRTEFIVINFLLFLTLALAGVYPNFHHDFEFINTNNNSNKNENNVKIVNNNNWWKTANFYQIYPRSFKDSDGDGIGDLKGITSKLSYLKEIGITATWLSPIFKSPMVDFGYDISDFKEIDEIFGTMKDFEELIVEAKQLGIKIILDFVPNHSSDKHEWFIKSAKGDKTYADFYVWHPGKPNPNNPNGRNLPPSNWLSVFRGSAWTWVETRKSFYLHQFASGQPDLNYKNPKVKEAMKDVLRFWLEKGVDGFRIDAVPHVFECANKEDGSFVDEPVSGWSDDPEDYGYLKHICTVDQPETLQLVYDWRKVMDEFQVQNGSETKVLLTEQWSPIEIAMQYYGTKQIPGAHVPFNFFIIQDIWRNDNAKKYAEVINKWLSQMDDFRIPNWVLGNHDKNRVGSRLGTDRMDMMNMMVMTLPGVAITYQGEEIGMTDVSISWEDTKDPQACNSDKTKYAALSRDPERTPFQWNDEKNSGFSDAGKTWLPMALNYTKANVKYERGIARSKLNVYKALRDLRDEDAFRRSFKAKVVALNDNVLAILRSYKNDHYITLMNVNDEIESVNIQKEFPEVPKELEYVVVTDRSPHSFGDEAYADEIVLLQKEAVVLRSKNNKKSLNFYQYKLN